MSRESHLELKVGSFVLLALIGLSYFIASVSNFSFMEKGKMFQVVFTFANGLKEAAPVRLAGVDAGIVKKMAVFVDGADDNKTKVSVQVFIKEGVSIPKDSIVTINQLGLLGEKYIEIMPGKSGEFIDEKTILLGSDPVPIEKITERVSHLAEKLEITVDSVNEVLVGVKEGKGTVGKLLVDEGIYKNLEDLTADLKLNPWKLLYRPKK